MPVDHVVDRAAAFTGLRRFGAVEDGVEDRGVVEGGGQAVGGAGADDDRVQDGRVDERTGRGQPPPATFAVAQPGFDGVEYVLDDLDLDPVGSSQDMTASEKQCATTEHRHP